MVSHGDPHGGSTNKATQSYGSKVNSQDNWNPGTMTMKMENGKNLAF
jgi:hypothetical protein